MKIPFRVWFSHRYIFLCEVVGYTFTAVVAIGVIYSLFTHVDVVVPATGNPTPTTAEVLTEKECLLTDYLIPSGAPVAKGQPVARVVSEARAQRVVQARGKLREALALLEQASGSGDGAAAQVQQALTQLEAPSEAVTLTAPAAGRLRREHEAGAEPCPAGTVVARVYDFSELVLDATIDAKAKSADKVAVGNVVTLKFPDGPELPGGVVETVAKEGDQSKVMIRWKQVPETVQDRFAQAIFGENADAALDSLHANIVVGQETLFKRTFGRQSQ